MPGLPIADEPTAERRHAWVALPLLPVPMPTYKPLSRSCQLSSIYPPRFIDLLPLAQDIAGPEAENTPFLWPDCTGKGLFVHTLVEPPEAVPVSSETEVRPTPCFQV